MFDMFDIHFASNRLFIMSYHDNYCIKKNKNFPYGIYLFIYFLYLYRVAHSPTGGLPWGPDLKQDL